MSMHVTQGLGHKLDMLSNIVCLPPPGRAVRNPKAHSHAYARSSGHEEYDNIPETIAPMAYASRHMMLGAELSLDNHEVTMLANNPKAAWPHTDNLSSKNNPVRQVWLAVFVKVRCPCKAPPAADPDLRGPPAFRTTLTLGTIAASGAPMAVATRPRHPHLARRQFPAFRSGSRHRSPANGCGDNPDATSE